MMGRQDLLSAEIPHKIACEVTVVVSPGKFFGFRNSKTKFFRPYDQLTDQHFQEILLPKRFYHSLTARKFAYKSKLLVLGPSVVSAK